MQSWDGLDIIAELPGGRGRGVNNEVVCDYGGQLLCHKDGKTKYESTPEHSTRFMFSFRHKRTALWRDATENLPVVSSITPNVMPM